MARERQLIGEVLTFRCIPPQIELHGLPGSMTFQNGPLAARVGEQTGLAVSFDVNRIPSRASRSIWGVCHPFWL